MKNSCLQWDSNPIWDLKSCSTDWTNRAWWKLYYLNDLYTYMYFRYQCIHWDKFENDKEGRKCTVLCYILEYNYFVQKGKRRTHPVFAFNMQIPDKVEYLFLCVCWKQAQDLCVSLLSGLWVRVPLWALVILYFVAFDALLAGRLVPYKWNQAWRSSEVYRCIERIIIWKKMAAVLAPSTR